MVHAQKKGKRGEVEFCDWLKKHFDIDTERLYNQADGKSADIVIDDFVFEIKRRESLDLDSWWWQCVKAQKGKHPDLIPVVAYRQNRQKWNFLIPARLIVGLDRGYLIASETVFLQLVRGIVRSAS